MKSTGVFKYAGAFLREALEFYSESLCDDEIANHAAEGAAWSRPRGSQRR